MTIEQYWMAKEDKLVQKRDEYHKQMVAELQHVQWDTFLPLAEAAAKQVLRKVANRVAYFIVMDLLFRERSFYGAWKVRRNLIQYGRIGMFQFWRASSIPGKPCESLAVLGADAGAAQAVFMQTGPLDNERIAGGAANLFFEYKDQKPMLCVYPARNGGPAKWSVFSWYTYASGNYKRGLGKLIPESISEEAKSLFPLLDEFERRARHHKQAEEHCQLRGQIDQQIRVLQARRAVWSEIILPEAQVFELMKQADMFLENDRARPQATLLKGPPGTGKTLLASTLAKAMGCNFIKVSIADLKMSHLGESGQRVRELWKEARAKKPAVLFVDECEAIFGKRGAAETDVIATELTQAFLAEWNAQEDRVWLIAATNHCEMLDEAILSRFGSEIEILLPDETARKKILRKELGAAGFRGEMPSEMGSLTQGMSGRDLYHLARRIKMDAYPGQPDREHFLAAVKAVRKAGNTSVDPGACWDALVLDDQTLAKLKTICGLLKNAEEWAARGIHIPSGLLLCGNPGTGKTQIARTIANECGLTFLAATTSDVKANFLGQSGNKVKNLFERARSQAPCILFLDELDIIAPNRVASQYDALTSEIVGQLLQEMDGIRQTASHVFVLGATNHESLIDSALLSRMQERITIPMPDANARVRLLRMMLTGKKLSFPLAEGAKYLSGWTEGMSGRDIKNWIAKAEQAAVGRALALGGPERFSLDLVDFVSTAPASDSAQPTVV